MTPDNTVVIGTLAENPYAEYMGDINNEYCQSEKKEGCRYIYNLNIYLPDEQSRTLDIDYDDFSKQILKIIK